MAIDGAIDFYDDLHTNILGSEKCSLYYGRYLSEKYSHFPDKDAELTNDWNKCVAETKAVLEEGESKTLEMGQRKLKDIQVEVKFDGNIGIFNNITALNDEIEYAWSVYEVKDGNTEVVDSIWYTDKTTLEYKFDAEKVYSVVSFIRLKNQTEEGIYEQVATIMFNEEKGIFENVE